MNRKVTVVGGAGNVGATVARAIADKELADVVIIDIADQKAKGKVVAPQMGAVTATAVPVAAKATAGKK